MNITLVCPCPKELYDHERGPWSPLPLHLIIMEHCLKTGDGNEKRMTRGVLLAFIFINLRRVPSSPRGASRYVNPQDGWLSRNRIWEEVEKDFDPTMTLYLSG